MCKEPSWIWLCSHAQVLHEVLKFSTCSLHLQLPGSGLLLVCACVTHVQKMNDAV